MACTWLLTARRKRDFILQEEEVSEVRGWTLRIAYLRVLGETEFPQQLHLSMEELELEKMHCICIDSGEA